MEVVRARSSGGIGRTVDSATADEEVDSRDPFKLTFKDDIVRFVFFDKISTHVDFEDQVGVLLTSGEVNKSPMHYIGAQVYPVKELKRCFTGEGPLFSDVELAGHETMVRCSTGTWCAGKLDDIFG